MNNSNTGLAEHLLALFFTEKAVERTHTCLLANSCPARRRVASRGLQGCSDGFQSQVLLHQASAFTAVTWCENANNQLAGQTCNEAGFSSYQRWPHSNKSKKKGGRT